MLSPNTCVPWRSLMTKPSTARCGAVRGRARSSDRCGNRGVVPQEALKVKTALAVKSSSVKVSKITAVDYQVGVSAADAVVEMSVWNMQSTRSLIAYAEWVHHMTFELGSATLVSSVDFFGQVIGIGEMAMPNEQPKDKSKVWNRVGIVLGLVDRSTSCDRTVGREDTSRTSAAQCEQKMKRVLVRQRGDPTSVWQPNQDGVGENEPVSMARVGCSRQSVVPGVEPREYRVCRSCIHRCVEREKRRTAESHKDSELLRNAQSAIQQPSARSTLCAEPEQTISGVTFRWDAQ